MKLDELTRSRGFESFISDRLGNQLFIDDPERAARIYKYAASGSDGSTHAEHIQDWRDYLDLLDLPDETKEAITAEIDKCEAWHEAAGTLNKVIG